MRIFITTFICLFSNQLLFGQFILGDAEGRSTFLYSPSAISIDVADNKLKLDLNNLVSARSKVASFIWGTSFSGGSNNNESFLFQGGKFVFGSKINAFIGYTTQIGKPGRIRRQMEKVTKDDGLDVIDKYNILYNEFIQSVGWTEKKWEEFNYKFFNVYHIDRVGLIYSPINVTNSESFLAKPKQVNLKSIVIADFKKQYTGNRMRKFLSQELKLKYSQINEIQTVYLQKVAEQVLDFTNEAADLEIFKVFEPLIKKMEKEPKKLLGLLRYFELDVSKKKANRKSYASKIQIEVLSGDDNYMDVLISKGFSHEDLLRIEELFYLPLLKIKQKNLIEQGDITRSRRSKSDNARVLEYQYGVWKSTYYIRSGLFGSKFTRLEPLMSTNSAVPDSLAFKSEKFNGDFLEIGLNLTGKGRHYWGVSYTWEKSNTFALLEEGEYAITRVSTIGGQPFQTTESRTAFAGDYITQERKVFSVDYARLIDLSPKSPKDGNILGINPYFRHVNNTSNLIKNESIVGLGFNFYKKDSKFLFGLFLQKNDAFNDNRMKGEVFRDTLDFGFRAAYAFSKIDGLRK